MSKQGNKAVIGAFVVGALVLTVVGVLAFGSGTLFKTKNTYVMYFDGDLKGLNVGAPVAFRGVRVGQVTEIQVFFNTDTMQFQVPVAVEIEPSRFKNIGMAHVASNTESGLKALINKGMRARLVLQNIVTGQLMIQLDMYPNEPVQLRGNGEALEIPTIASGLERLTQAIEEISFKELVDNINQAVTQVGKILDQQELEHVLSSIQTAANEVGILAKNLNQEAIPLIQSLKRTSDNADDFIRGVDQQVDPVLTDTRAALESVRLAMEQADQTLQSIDTLAEGYTERSAFRYEVSNALREIAAAASSLRVLTDMLQQQPDALIRGKGNPGGH
jgi:paraquat-inducible protein B